MPDFDALAATAKRLIAENGRPLVLKRGTAPAAGEYDPVDGAALPDAPAGADLTFPIRAVVLAMTTGYTMRVGSQNVQARDRLLLVSGDVQPIADDVISFDGEDWQVVRVEEQAPNGTSLMFTCQVRP